MSAAATGETQTVGMRGLECLEGYRSRDLIGVHLVMWRRTKGTLVTTARLLGLTAARPEHVRPMIAQALEHDGPPQVEVLVHRRKGP